LRANWLFVVFLGIGTVLRVITWLAYQPAMLYIDSFRYLIMLGDPAVDGLDPIGYTIILYPMIFVGKLFGAGLALTSAVQHLVGLALAVLMYRICRGLGAVRWVSALITVPILMDAYQLQIEQNIMAEIWSDAFLLVAVWLLIAWRLRRPGDEPDPGDPRHAPGAGPLWYQAAIAGALIGANVPVRIIGIVAVIPFVAYLILVGARWRDRRWWRTMLTRLAAGLAGFAIILGGYMVVYRVATGHVGLSGATGSVLYGRAATIARCDDLPLNRYQRMVCPKEPLGERLGVDAYAHNPMERPEGLPQGMSLHRVRSEFGKIVLRHQPLDLAVAVTRDFLKGFEWSKVDHPGDTPLKRWQFQIDYPRWEATDADKWTLYFDRTVPHVITPLTTFLRSYQLHHGYVPGTLLGVAGLVGVAGVLRRRRGGESLRSESLLTVGMALVLLGGAAGFEFSFRYQLPGLVFLPLAGAIGFTALTSRERGPMEAYPDDVDAMAVQGFEDRYGAVKFPDLVVVIAAYNEERGIGRVLDRMPKTCPTPDGGTLDIATLVLVDGSTDRTAEIADQHGAYVCVAPVNRGQGGALRLGYHLAAEHGATYIVTTDADGQYEIDELPQLLEPVLTDRADFSTGSRRLGTGEYDSNVRWVGVRVFAALATVLTRTKITDTSFGFRAMRAEVAQGAVLTEPQYQASELLLGVMARGARMVEVPLTMRLRNNGASKKGGSITYGANYARVMLTTWWREWVVSGENRRLRRLSRTDRQQWAERQRWRKTSRSSNVNLKKNTTP
jgi:glycosyltransferase involved in cell wall biosynthesis